MPLDSSKTYFVSKPDVYLRSTVGGGKKVNHLLLGDWLSYEGQTRDDWAKVRCRGDVGWLPIQDITEERALEVNFVDVGQGDGCHIVTPYHEIILIDAGVHSHMNRFLTWRYGLRSRNVERAPDFDPSNPNVQEPWKIHHVVITHPDNDHYYGFLHVFENPKLRFENVYHNGIVERPLKDNDPADDDLGGYASSGKKQYLWDVINSSDKMKSLIGAHPKSRKQYLSTLRACVANSKDVTFNALSTDISKLNKQVYVGPFDPTSNVTLRVLGPISESVTYNGNTRQCLRKLGNEGVTKNGHSVILKLQYEKLAIMLGGDLNTQAQDFLLQSYTSVENKASLLERKVAKLNAKGSSATEEELQALHVAQAKLDTIIDEARAYFECDVTKACHHGSSHFTHTFLRALNAVATVISSGDGESHSHPRPDALGAFGQHGRGDRPLIFSTELARSTREFTSVAKCFSIVRDFICQHDAAQSNTELTAITRKMEEHQDRNVAVYGMITLRALDDQIIIAQKLEEPRRGTKWDIYRLSYNTYRRTIEYDRH